jgi:L-ascorbate metabolism protein UlaG (beta-lactamase superfamily)
MDPLIAQIVGFLTVGVVSLSSLTCSAQTPHPDKPHHTGHGFRNVYDSEQPAFLDFLRWRWERIWKDIPGPEDYHFPLAENDPTFLGSNDEKITLTWIGHATCLLQMNGKNILTDPHFSQRASPLKWAGPQRVVPPGLSVQDLPQIHMVFISHDHYDSLDKRTIMALYGREGGQKTIFFVPLGLGSWFKGLGISRVLELDWWDQHREGDLEIIAVPVQHWSKRDLFSRNKTLWAGWIVRSNAFRFLFVGDTGFTPLFKEIGDRFGPFDLSAIPIGAYEPGWFMGRHHITPEEAVRIHLDVRSKKSVAIHWGTFILTDERLDEPPERLERARREEGLSGADFLVLRHGETIILDQKRGTTKRGGQ